MNKLLENLNSEQRQAITSSEGPFLIVAGSGTGKTRVITTRIAYILEIKPNIAPSEILAITFTKKAADEMLDRLGNLALNISELWISTFHAFSYRILRDHAIDIGLGSNFRLLDAIESRIFFKKVKGRFKLKYFSSEGEKASFDEAVLKFISRLKDELVSASELEKFAKNIKDKEEREKYLDLSHIFALYEESKLKENVVDFGDLITKSIKLFKERPLILSKYQEQFKYILVDEFQDTNIAQIELVSMLAEKNKNICVVGDDDQAIYRFRGASFASFLKFKEKFPALKTIKLTQNYRSTKNILNAATLLIKNNDIDRFDPKKGLWTENPQGDPVKLIINDDYPSEARYIVDRIKELCRSTKDYRSIAVLYRAHLHKDELIRLLKKEAIPYQIYGGTELFENFKIKQLVSYMKAAHDPFDSPNLYSLMMDMAFDIEKDDIIKLNKFASFNDISLYQALDKLDEVIFEDDAKTRIRNFKRVLKELMVLAKRTNVDDFAYELSMVKTMIIRELFMDYTKDKEREAKALGVFFKFIRQFALNHFENSLFSFLEYIDTYLEAKGTIELENINYKDNAVQLMTVHQAKGLEFPNLFIISLVQTRFPTPFRKEEIAFPTELMKEDLPRGNFHIEEERRLFYVAMTRARKRLILTSVVKPYHKKSVFLEEIKDNIEIEESPVKEEFQDLVSNEADLRTIQFHKKISSIADSLKHNKSESSSVKEAKMILEEEFNSFVTDISKPSVKLKLEETSFLLPSDTIFSYSKLDTYISCPLKYKFNYLDFVPKKPRSYLVFGDVIHKVLKEFYTLIQNGKSVNEKVLLDFYEEFWSPLGYGNKEEANLKKKEGHKLLKNFFRKNESQLKAPLFLEKKFFLKIADYTIKGFIDRIDEMDGGKVMIIDYKTGKKIKKPSFQLDIYAMACMEELGLDVGSLAYYYVTDNELVQLKRSEEDIEKTKEKIRDIIAQMKTSIFPPKPDYFTCKNCDYKLLCPAYK